MTKPRQTAPAAPIEVGPTEMSQEASQALHALLDGYLETGAISRLKFKRLAKVLDCEFVIAKGVYVARQRVDHVVLAAPRRTETSTRESE